MRTEWLVTSLLELDTGYAWLRKYNGGAWVPFLEWTCTTCMLDGNRNAYHEFEPGRPVAIEVLWGSERILTGKVSCVTIDPGLRTLRESPLACMGVLLNV